MQVLHCTYVPRGISYFSHAFVLLNIIEYNKKKSQKKRLLLLSYLFYWVNDMYALGGVSKHRQGVWFSQIPARGKDLHEHKVSWTLKVGEVTPILWTNVNKETPKKVHIQISSQPHSGRMRTDEDAPIKDMWQSFYKSIHSLWVFCPGSCVLHHIMQLVSSQVISTQQLEIKSYWLYFSENKQQATSPLSWCFPFPNLDPTEQKSNQRITIFLRSLSSHDGAL